MTGNFYLGIEQNGFKRQVIAHEANYNGVTNDTCWAGD